MDKIRILFIHHGTGIGGAPISLLNLIKQLDKDRYHFKVAFISGGKAEKLFTNNNIETDVIKTSSIFFGHHEKGKTKLRHFWRYPRVYLEWKKALKVADIFLKKNSNFDIVHLNSDVLSSWAYAANKNGLKVVCHNRDPIAKGFLGIRYRVLKRLIRENVDTVISISKDNRERLGLQGQTKVVYNFTPIPSQYRIPMQTSEKGQVLYLGGNARIKGFESAVNCLPYLNSGIQLLFAGNYGRLENPKTLKEKVKNWVKLNVYRSAYRPLKDLLEAPNAEMLGLLMDPLPVIDACDILISPFAVEHFSRPAMEAMAYGKPVIGTDVEGMDEIIDHGETGLIVEKDNPQALAEAINYLCDHPEVAREMGRKGREKAKQLFSPEKNTAMVEIIYEQLVDDKENES